MPHYIYRQAGLSDIDALVAVRMDFMRMVGVITSSEQECELYQTNLDFLRNNLPSKDYIHIIALDSDKIISSGSVNICVLPPNHHRMNGKSAYIANMFTYPEYRGQGIATKLFDMCVNAAKTAECYEITLHATPMGKTIYEKYGFMFSDDAMIYILN